MFRRLEGHWEKRILLCTGGSKIAPELEAVEKLLICGDLNKYMGAEVESDALGGFGCEK